MNAQLTISAILLISFLAGCTSATPDPGAVQTAIALTAAANPTLPPTATETPLPTATFTPTPTDTPTPTFTPTPTETPTQTPSPTPDLRVIDGDPRDFLLQKEDLPSEAKYYLPNYGWISPHRNSEVVSGMGVKEGREYLEATGRVDGWYVYYNRGTSTVIAPEEIYDYVALFQTNEGALVAINTYSTCKDPDIGYQLMESDMRIGEMTLVCKKRVMQSTGENRVAYLIEFVYRNFFHAVIGWGWEDEVRLEYVEAVARTLLAKLEAAPLSDKVIFTP